MFRSGIFFVLIIFSRFVLDTEGNALISFVVGRVRTVPLGKTGAVNLSTTVCVRNECVIIHFALNQDIVTTIS